MNALLKTANIIIIPNPFYLHRKYKESLHEEARDNWKKEMGKPEVAKKVHQRASEVAQKDFGRQLGSLSGDDHRSAVHKALKHPDFHDMHKKHWGEDATNKWLSGKHRLLGQEGPSSKPRQAPTSGGEIAYR